jgi:hypothetical protein
MISRFDKAAWLVVLSLAAVTCAWAQWNIQTVDGDKIAGPFCKVLSDSTGTPNIFYAQGSGSGGQNPIKHAQWTGSGWHFEQVTGNGPDLLGSNIAACMDKRGGWHLSNGFPGGYTWNINYSWSAAGVWRDTTLNTGNQVNSVAIAADTGCFPHIVYQANGLLFHLWQVKVAPPTWSMDTIDIGSNLRRPAMVIDSLNHIYVAYYDAGDLKMAYFDGNKWGTHIVDMQGGNVGDYCDLKLNSSGNVCISYYDATNGALKYAVGTKSSYLGPKTLSK